jgi:hypothetical protein
MLLVVGLTLLWPMDVRVTWDLHPPPQSISLASCARVTSGRAPESPLGIACCVGQKNGQIYLLTAASVVPKGEPRFYDFVSGNPTPTTRRLTSGVVVVRANNINIALVKLPCREPIPILPLADVGDRPRDFPFVGYRVTATDRATVECRWELVTGKRFLRRSEGSSFAWDSTATATRGWPGSPLVSPQGCLIGIETAAEGGRILAAHHDELLLALKSYGYDWLFRRSSTSQP